MKKLFVNLLLVLALCFSVGSCKEKNEDKAEDAMEETMQEAEEAAEDTGDAIEEAADETEAAAEEAAEEVEEEVSDDGNQVVFSIKNKKSSGNSRAFFIFKYAATIII